MHCNNKIAFSYLGGLDVVGSVRDLLGGPQERLDRLAHVGFDLVCERATALGGLPRGPTVRVDVRLHRHLLVEREEFQHGEDPRDDLVDGGFDPVVAAAEAARNAGRAAEKSRKQAVAAVEKIRQEIARLTDKARRLSPTPT